MYIMIFHLLIQTQPSCLCLRLIISFSSSDFPTSDSETDSVSYQQRRPEHTRVSIKKPVRQANAKRKHVQKLPKRARKAISRTARSQEKILDIYQGLADQWLDLATRGIENPEVYRQLFADYDPELHMRTLVPPLLMNISQEEELDLYGYLWDGAALLAAGFYKTSKVLKNLILFSLKHNFREQAKAAPLNNKIFWGKIPDWLASQRAPGGSSLSAGDLVIRRSSNQGNFSRPAQKNRTHFRAHTQGWKNARPYNNQQRPFNQRAQTHSHNNFQSRNQNNSSQSHQAPPRRDNRNRTTK
uniref:Translation initiation factor IF-2 n=1 Tax=Lygus hesperus TaxID=30085 RepID=A0A0A9YHT2_LYGHE